MTSLKENESVDLAIIGAGFLGLSTALAAARVGLRVRLIEARRLGAAASGLNGGQVIPGLKYDPDWLLARFGAERGEAACAFAASTADRVFDLIAAEALAVPALRAGWIQAATTQAGLAACHARAAQWGARGADVSPLNARQISELTGTIGYLGGWIDRRAGVIDPVCLVSEMARVVTEAGAEIAEGISATALRQEARGWEVSTTAGRSVRARFVLVATNAYSDALIPGLARTLVPLHSFQIATEQLDARAAQSILPGGQAVSDSRRILVYYRKTQDGRLILGGRGRHSLPRSDQDWAHLERALRRLYPELAGISITRRWFGRVAVTPDHLPHLHEPAPGLLAAVGCQGRGVGLMVSLGPLLAEYLSRRDPTVLPLPITPIRPIPFHGLRQIGVAAAIAWYRTLDALER